MAINKEKNKTLQVTIPLSLYDFLENLSESSGESKSQWIISAINILVGMARKEIEIVASNNSVRKEKK